MELYTFGKYRVTVLVFSGLRMARGDSVVGCICRLEHCGDVIYVGADT